MITHAHEDHYGALMALWPSLRVPVYMTAFAAGLLRAKMAETAGAPDIDIRLMEQGERLTIGTFDVEVIPVSHSIAEPCALALRTPEGMALHTGDWKLDADPGVGRAIDLEAFRKLGEEGVAALIADSTNAMREGSSVSEAKVTEQIRQIIEASPHRVVVTTFSSQIARIIGVARAAQACGREVVVMGRAMHRVITVADELGLLEELPAFRDQDMFGYFPRDKTVVIMTGSQGEERAALAKIARDDHRDVTLEPGDRVIFSSFTIPGNELTVNTIINQLCDKGIEVITNRDAMVHSSGHPPRKDMETLYQLLKPQCVIPAHGEPMHLVAHAKFARDMGVPTTVAARNGTIVQLVPGTPEIVDEAFAGRIYRDGELLIDPDDSGVDERRKLMFSGAVVVVLAMEGRGKFLDECEVEVFGLPEHDAGGEPMIDLIGDAVDDAVGSIPKNRKRDVGLVREAARRAARNAVNRAWGKKPLVRVIIFPI